MKLRAFKIALAFLGISVHALADEPIVNQEIVKEALKTESPVETTTSVVVTPPVTVTPIMVPMTKPLVTAPYPVPVPVDYYRMNRFHVGVGFVLGIPSGVGLGVVANPFIDWLRLGASFQENVLSPGARFSIQVDPMALRPNLPIGVFIDGQYGFFVPGNVPGHAGDFPAIGYSYESLLGGLRLGKAHGFQFDLEAGYSHIGVTSRNFQETVSKNAVDIGGLTLANPTASVWAPSIQLGFTYLW
jgi:hypothetical protein